MEFIKSAVLSISEKRKILDLWNNEYPEKLNYKSLTDFENYLGTLTEQSHILMSDNNKDIKGWYFDFIRENKRWFAIILDSKVHGLGFGTQILNIAKEKELELYGWVIDHNNDKKQNGEIYKSPLSFYIRNGFEVLMKKRLELDLISAVQIYWKK
ncbi:N-acetyltransferase [Arenibacter sp. TNZ]|uniref:N-acetyltransferase n=1 Tax=Arenibacter TaxID=178469 RepID=UPI000CD461D2|nr:MULTISPECIES: N-acetyltransferase [Arenibacter]MCM4172773.1 N-acetyltransferase [Arenibacter sp. TNZ]